LKIKIVSGIMLTLLLMGMLTLAFNIQPAKAESGTIYIRADGSIDPPTANITSLDNVTYALTDDIINDMIVAQRSNIRIDGKGYRLQGLGLGYNYGFILWGINNVAIQNTNIKDCGVGVLLNSSSYNTVSGNTITNTYHGIFIQYSSNNSIYRNNVITNNVNGILLLDSSNNTISGNTITNNNEYGVRVYLSSNNKFYHNNFINNTHQVVDESRILPISPSINTWDDGYPSGGNYWSDYTIRYPDAQELDDSGIWDTPYVIDENNQDNYPLMEAWTPNPAVAIPELIETITDWNLPKGTENSLTSKLEDSVHLLDIGSENGAIHKLMGFMNQAEALRGKKLTNEQADYLTSEAQRIIDLINELVPQPSFFIILPKSLTSLHDSQLKKSTHT